MSPLVRKTLPGFADNSRNCFSSPDADSDFTGPSSQVTDSASRPFIAAQVESATTATPDIISVGLSRPSIFITLRTPGTARALLESTLATLPLKTGHRSMLARSIPGTRTSIPNRGLPVAIGRLSTPERLAPINRKSFESLSFGSVFETGIFEAVPTSAPYDNLLPDD